MISRSLVAAAVALSGVFAAPTPADVAERSLVTGLLGDVVQDIDSALQAGQWSSVLSNLRKATPTATPTAIPQAFSTLSSIHAASPSSLYDYDAALVANGLVSGTVDSLLSFVQGALTGENSDANMSVRLWQRTCDYS